MAIVCWPWQGLADKLAVGGVKVAAAKVVKYLVSIAIRRRCEGAFVPVIVSLFGSGKR